jgi:glycosyltransferase involved in cell wall biosynthesis
MNYEVTIGIPAYKAADYIGRTMESALNQTFSNIEYLIVDDCGHDGTINVVERFQKEHPRGKDIRILYNQQNLGVGKTRNIILEQAKGDYLFFLDSDDVLEPDAIEKMVGVARQYQADVVYGSWIRVDNVHHSPSQHNCYPDLKLLKPGELATYAFKNYSSFRISVCNALLSLNLIRTNHLRFLDTIYWEDLAFTYDLVPKVNRAILLSDITYQYLCRPDSLSQYQDREQLDWEEILRNVSTIDYMKGTCQQYKDQDFFPYLCYNLGMNSFYVVRYVLNHIDRIKPDINKQVLHDFMCFPAQFSEIIRFKSKKLPNLALWLISHLPPNVLAFTVRGLGRLKG